MSETDGSGKGVSDLVQQAPGGRRLIGGGTLTALSRAYIQATQLIIFVVAGRVLGPAEFGVFALVSAVAFLALKVAEAGWSEFIMSWAGPPAVVNQVCGLAWVSGAALAVIGLCAAMGASLFIDHASTPVLIAGFALWILLATPSTALTGVMIRDGRIALSAVVIIIAETVGLAVTLLALNSGQGIMSLVIGRLALQLVHLLLVQVLTRQAPRLDADYGTLAEVLRFSGNILASRLIVSLRFYSATFIVGGFLGPASVGYFRAAQRITGALGEIVGEPTRVLAWNTFRHARDSNVPGAIGRHAAIFFPALAVVAIPGFGAIALFGEEIVVGLLGEEWAPTAPVIVALSIAGLFLSMGAATEPLLSLTNNSHILPRLFAIYAVIGIGLTLAVAPFGMVPIALAQVVVSVFIFVVNLWLYRSRAGIRWKPIVVRMLPSVIPIMTSLGLLHYLDGLDVLGNLNPAARVVLLSLPVMVLYALLLAIFYLPMIRRLQAAGEEAR